MHVNVEEAWCAEVDATGTIHPVNSPDEAALVVLAGAYSTGKTSLIKRLLFEQGEPVPGDLRVGAGPTTFELRDLPCGDLILRDAPGLGSGSELHDPRALAAAIDADLLLLLVTPQLLAGVDSFWPLLTGQAWGAPGASDPSWVQLVVNRFDEAGPDPRFELDDYLELASRKTDELSDSLSRAGVPEPLPRLAFIAADAFCMVGDRPPQEGDYVESKSWDGIDQLRADLALLPKRLAHLRLRRAVRVRGHALSTARQSAQDAFLRVEAERTGLELRLNRLRAHQRDLERLGSRARAELDEVLLSAIGSDIRAAALPDRHRLVAARLSKVIEDWADGYVERLAELVQTTPEATGLGLPPDVGILELEADDLDAGATSMKNDILRKIRDNASEVRAATKSAHELASSVPKLSKVAGWLSPKVVDSALAAAALWIQLSPSAEEQEKEAYQSTRATYLKAGQGAALGMVSQVDQWRDDYLGELAEVGRRLEAERAEILTAAGQLDHSREAIDELLRTLPS